jgi:glycosidase
VPARPHPHLLEISAWPWLERLSSRGAGEPVTLGSVPPPEWDAIAALGFDYVYLMGVWRRSPLGRELARTDPALRAEYDRVLPGWTEADVPGSPYCISAYEPDDRMGGWAGLDGARAALHARGMGLFVDFVPNHTGFDHPWVATHPTRYVLGDEPDWTVAPEDFHRADRVMIARGRDPYFAPWRDVAQLNYCNPDTRQAMIDVLRQIAAHADGVRCDMAMLVLNQVFDATWRRVLRERWPMPAGEFWPEAIAAVPSLIYLAEVYWDLEWRLQQQGFQFTYDKRLLDRLHASPPSDVRGQLLAQPPFRDRLARFLENHDEPRSACALGARLEAAAAMLASIPGMRFFFDGQLDGARVRAPVQLGRWPEEQGSPAVRDIYERLLAAADENVFHDGDWTLLDVTRADDDSYADILAWRWRHGENIALVAVNLGGNIAHGHVAPGDLPDGGAWNFEDRLTGARYRWTREALTATGLYVRLEGGRAHVFEVRRAND